MHRQMSQRSHPVSQQLPKHEDASPKEDSAHRNSLESRPHGLACMRVSYI